MDASTRENFSTTSSMVMASTPGQMVRSTTVNGNKINIMGMLKSQTQKER